VDNSRLVVAVMLGLFLAAMVGCGDTPARESDTKVADAVKRAERLCDRAQTIMAEVPFLIDGKMAPLFEPSHATTPKGTFDISKMDELNPKAVAALEEARSALKDVLGESDAPVLAQALARSAMARVRVLQGRCESYNAVRAREKAAAAGTMVNELVLRATTQLSVLDCADDPSGASARGAGGTVKEKIAELIESAKAEVSQRGKDVQAVQTVLDEQTTVRDGLVKQATADRKALTELEQKKALAAGDDKVALILQVELKEIELSKTLQATAAAETTMARAAGAVQRRKAFLDDANVRLKGLETREAERQAAADEQAKKRGEAAKAVTATAGLIEAEVKTLAAAWANLAGFEGAAQVCFDDAAELLGKARSLAGREAGAGGRGKTLTPSEAVGMSGKRMVVTSASAQGRAYLSSAELDVASLPQQRANVKLVEMVQRLWRDIMQRQGRDEDIPAELKAALESIVALPGKAPGGAPVDVASKRAAAAEKFDLAKKTLAVAIKAQDPNLRWADQGQLAYAKYMYAVYAQDSESILDAQNEILNALARNRESQYVKPLLNYEKMLTFGDLAFATVTDVSADGELLLAQGTDKGTYVKQFDDGRTAEELPGAVYFVGAKIDLQGKTYKAGDILLRVADGQYMPAPAGLKLKVPADMTIDDKPHKANSDYVVP